MIVTFYGAVREVTGSMHLIDNGIDRIIPDCGVFQGRRWESAEKNMVSPFAPDGISDAVLFHFPYCSGSWKNRPVAYLWAKPYNEGFVVIYSG